MPTVNDQESGRETLSAQASTIVSHSAHIFCPGFVTITMIIIGMYLDMPDAVGTNTHEDW